MNSIGGLEHSPYKIEQSSPDFPWDSASEYTLFAEEFVESSSEVEGL